jgi:hypothetical protein
MLEMTVDALTKDSGSIWGASTTALRCGLAFTRPEPGKLNTARRGRADPSSTNRSQQRGSRMNPAVPSPESPQPGEPHGIRSLPTRITNVVLKNLLRVVRFLGRALDGFTPNF